MIFKLISLYYLAVISLISASESAAIAGFSTDLIHRDSPLSPFSDESSSSSQRLVNALKRSIHRARSFDRSKLEKAEPDLISAGGEYLMKFSIGTPPVETVAIADTGSDVVWTQCSPCLNCFNQSLPLFSPRSSTSYARVPCSSPTCSTLRKTRCTRTRRNCLYSCLYGDGSFTEGILATENFSFSSGASGKTAAAAVVVPNITFGCGFSNGGVFSGIESGIVGLGGGRSSFIKQLGPLAGGKFSYCLVPLESNFNSSKLNFGAAAEVSGRGVVSTPLVVKENLETYYFLTIEGITVGKNRVEFNSPNSPAIREGNVIIDSGTTLTLLPRSMYEKLKKAMKSEIELKQIRDPSGVLDLCFFTHGEIRDFPPVTVHFRGGDVKWGFENAFVRTGEDSVCLAAKGHDGGFAIYGNLAQINFLVGFDLVKKTVSFKPTKCGRS